MCIKLNTLKAFGDFDQNKYSETNLKTNINVEKFISRSNCQVADTSLYDLDRHKCKQLSIITIIFYSNCAPSIP